MIGSKRGNNDGIFKKVFHTGMAIGNKISDVGHFILDNPLTESAVVAFGGPQALVGGKVALDVLDKGLSYGRTAEKITGFAKKNPPKYNAMI